MSFKKVLSITTALSIVLQPLSGAYGMKTPEEGEKDARSHSLKPSSPPFLKSLPESQDVLHNEILKSLRARKDTFSPLIAEIKAAFLKEPQTVQEEVKNKLPNLIEPSLSLYPWFLLRDESQVSKQPFLTPTHKAFRRLNEVIDKIQSYEIDPRLSPSLSSKLKQLRAQYQDYILTLCSLPLEERDSFITPVFLQGDLLEDTYLMPHSLAYDLLSMGKHGIPEKANATGSSIVSHVSTLYAKQNLIKAREEGEAPTGTLAPAMEWGMSAFHRLLFGEGLVPSALVVLAKVPVKGALSSEKEAEKRQLKEKRNTAQDADMSFSEREKKEIIDRLSEDEGFKSTKNYALQITSEVKGAFLADFLKYAIHTPSLFDTLDKPQVQELILTSFLTRPADAKGDNFIVTEPDRSGKRRIISIDNDLSLASPLIALSPTHHYTEVRNLLFCMKELMGSPLDPNVRDWFLSLLPAEILLKWLTLLHTHNQRYEELRGPLSAETFSLLQLPLSLKPGTLKKMREDWVKIQAHARLHPSATLYDLLETFSPLMGQYYKKLGEREGNSLKAFELLYTYHPTASFEEVLDLNQYIAGEKIQETLRKETTLRDTYKTRTQKIEDAVQELMENLDWVALPGPSCVRFLEELLISFPHLIRKISSSLLLHRVIGHQPSLNLLEALLKVSPHALIEKDHEGYTPLHHAILTGDTKALSFLLSKGADPDQETEDKSSALDLACEKQQEEIFTLLIQHGAKTVRPSLALKFYETLSSSLPFSPLSPAFSAYLTLLKRHQELSWNVTLNTLLPIKGKGHPVRMATFGERVLLESTYAQLFDAHGKLIKKNTSGRHQVGHISADFHGIPLTLYFKEYPELPGLEEAVGILTRKIFGFGAPFTELVRIRDRSFLISQGIMGPTLEEVLRKDPQKLSSFDSPSLSALILSSMLTDIELCSCTILLSRL